MVNSVSCSGSGSGSVSSSGSLSEPELLEREVGGGCERRKSPDDGSPSTILQLNYSLIPSPNCNYSMRQSTFHSSFSI